MQYQATSVTDYIAQIPQERKTIFQNLHETIMQNLPDGFVDIINYGMIGYVVPKTLYPSGYHCDTQLPLPFAALASQKNSINFYHMAIYVDPELEAWFRAEYPKHTKQKLDMGKSCIRFNKFDQIPIALIGELMQKISVDNWINLYEERLKK
jgi:hypothetical protein